MLEAYHVGLWLFVSLSGWVMTVCEPSRWSHDHLDGTLPLRTCLTNPRLDEFVLEKPVPIGGFPELVSG